MKEQTLIWNAVEEKIVSCIYLVFLSILIKFRTDMGSLFYFYIFSSTTKNTKTGSFLEPLRFGTTVPGAVMFADHLNADVLD